MLLPIVNYSSDTISGLFFIFSCYNLIIKKCEDIIAVVKSVLDKDDCMGFLALGAPKDEYYGIVQTIGSYKTIKKTIIDK